MSGVIFLVGLLLLTTASGLVTIHGGDVLIQITCFYSSNAYLKSLNPRSPKNDYSSTKTKEHTCILCHIWATLLK